MERDKTKYYKLDEIGIIGTQEEKSSLKKKREYERTARIIKKEKSANTLLIPIKKKAQ